MSRQEAISAIETVCKVLEQPLSSEEVAAGWSFLNQSHYLEQLEKLHADLANGKNPPYSSWGRGMDMSGISGGTLFERICEISNALNSRNWLRSN